ncbi:GNAT family N-acetyltransferase [Tropicibacter sp. Alg240-R139]|uniref:GNAT family N-acetyltransferase n=1 Tax=Tropicibacter sp. Alg240-R139 TaxID=2305991 RepID=UPI0013DF63A4|nr:GNAT family N-acetyltransferase [Tropicibacter sp. Alg240-R139]
MSQKMRKKLRRAERQVERMGARVFQSTRAEQAAHQTLILEHWAKFWDGKKTIENRDRFRARYHEHLSRAMQMGGLQLITLWAGDRFLGGTANLIDQEQAVLHSIVEGRDDDAGMDIGIVLNAEVVSRAAQMKLNWIDLGHGNHDYKYRLGAQDRAVSYLVLRRRSRSISEQLDPAMVPMAIEATKRFIRARKHEKARAAIGQLRGFIKI